MSGDWLTILQAPHEILSRPAAEVTVFDADLGHLIDGMSGKLRPKIIGLSAPQVGVSLRVLVIANVSMCNPVIVKKSPEVRFEREGCVSVEAGKRFVMKRRHVRIMVDYQDRNGGECTLVARGLLARCIQHEMDHLDGKLISDVAPPPPG